ncbi:MAG: hypothetical protein ACKVYV_14120 [Limisphaerales bacterium]
MPDPNPSPQSTAAPWLGRVIALGMLLMFIMVAVGVWGVLRHAREQERVTREGGGLAPAAAPARP